MKYNRLQRICPLRPLFFVQQQQQTTDGGNKFLRQHQNATKIWTNVPVPPILAAMYPSAFVAILSQELLLLAITDRR